MTSNKFFNLTNKEPLNEEQKHLGVFPKDRIVFNHAVAEWCLHNAELCISRNTMEEALQWDALAAGVLSFECAALTSPELEKQLVLIGNSLKPPKLKTSFCQTGPKRWLHVLTTAFSSGGHSSMLKRWIQLDLQQNKHSVVLLGQKGPVPETLVEIVQLTGGDVIRMDSRDTTLSRAIRLREIVWTQADIVVLHIHPWDIIPTVALALPGGPPVLLVNHAAHLFWVGTSVTDMILNCRYSSQEDEWTEKYRGIDKIMHLPIPLSEPNYIVQQNPKFREIARKRLQVPEDVVVMLTIGIGSKYSPLPGVDFFQAIGSVLKTSKNAYLIAVGPDPDVYWTNLSKEVEGRLLLVEKQPHSEISTYFAAADLYLEGFPFGSTTALLEAGVMGIPCVLPPKGCPPPFTSDGIALHVLEKLATVSDYVEYIQRLLNDRQERLRLGELIASSIKAHHCGEAWTEYLAKVQNNLPTVHGVRMVSNPMCVPADLSAYWAAFSSVINGDPLAFVHKHSLFPSLKTRTIDEELRKLILSGKTGYEIDKLTLTLMDIGDHYYWQYDFIQARQFYEYAIKHNPLRLRILSKYILLIMGHSGVRLRTSLSRLKQHFCSRITYLKNLSNRSN